MAQDASRSGRLAALASALALGLCGCGEWNFGDDCPGTPTTDLIEPRTAFTVVDGTVVPGLTVGDDLPPGAWATAFVVFDVDRGYSPYTFYFISTATLIVQQSGLTGAPFPKFGAVVVDVIDAADYDRYVAGFLTAQDLVDHPATIPALGVLSADAAPGERRLDLATSRPEYEDRYGTEAVPIVLRLRFTGAPDADAAQDSVDFGPPVNQPGQPLLRVEALEGTICH